MRVVDRLARRESSWGELHVLLQRLDAKPIRRYAPEEVGRLGELYRSACADLMLAEAHDLPRSTVDHLHGLVGRGHNAVYRARGFRLGGWGRAIFEEVPRRLRADIWLRVAALAFWGPFLLTALLAAARPGFAPAVVGQAALDGLESMYEHAFDGTGPAARDDATMAGFYINHNAGIGLGCYAWGLAFGVGTLWVVMSNAIQLGTMFGHMATAPQAASFYTFVTAHGPFELTAIVFAGAAGLRLGSGWIFTEGQTRLGSLRREAANSLPTAGVSVILFVLAAFLEGFVSASALPYAAKFGIAAASAALLLAYLLALGRGPRRSRRAVAGGEAAVGV